MKFASLNELYLQQLKDLHSAESQLIKALPKMAKAARNPDLKNAFIEHLEQTKGHLERLKQVAEKLGKRLAGHTCAAEPCGSCCGSVDYTVGKDLPRGSSTTSER